MSGLILFMLFFNWICAQEQTCPPDKQRLFPYFYRQPNLSLQTISHKLEFYDDSDMLSLGIIQLDSVDLFGSDSTSTISTTIFAMRISTESGFVKWVKAVRAKTISRNDIILNSLQVTAEQVAWANVVDLLTPYIYRISGNGTILQVICFGPKNLSFAARLTILKVISETEFLISIDVSQQNSNISVSMTSGSDLSVARVSTDLNTIYNLMIDYKNGIDVGTGIAVKDNICFVLAVCVYNGYIFSMFPLSKDKIDIEMIKQSSFLLEGHKEYDFSILPSCKLSQSMNNIDVNYNDMIGIVCQPVESQIKIMNFNLTSSFFQSTIILNLSTSYYLAAVVNYNTTLIFFWGGNVSAGSRNTYILKVDTLTQVSQTYYVSYQGVAYINFYNKSIYTEVTDLAFGMFSILNTGFDFETDKNCNAFVTTKLYQIEITREDPVLYDLNSSDLDIVFTTNYLQLFNITETPYPVYEKYVTYLFWPQSQTFGDAKVCQPSGLISTNTILNWMLNESNMQFEIIPFTNCQGIPVNITLVKSSYFDNSLITVNGTSVIIDSGFGNKNALKYLNSSDIKSKVYPNQTVAVIIEAQTNTFVPIPTQISFNIKVNNFIPKLTSQTDSIKVKISEGLNLKVIYSNFCVDNSSSISVSDDEGDSIYMQIFIEEAYFSTSIIILDEQNCEFELSVNISDYIPGNYSMKLVLWDIFHDIYQTQNTINLNISYFTPPEFVSNLPSLAEIQTCIESSIELPKIIDKDGDFSSLRCSTQM